MARRLVVFPTPSPIHDRRHRCARRRAPSIPDSRAGGPLPCAINLPKPEPEPLDWDAFFDIFADHWMAKFYRNQTGRDDPILREG